MIITARAAAEKIVVMFQKHWAAFRQEMRDDKELQSCRDKAMAWTMATSEMSRWVFKQAKR